MAAPIKAGAHVEQYELLSPIGAGGMGEVWTARDTRLDCIVAVKFSQAQFTEHKCPVAGSFAFKELICFFVRHCPQFRFNNRPGIPP